MWVYRIVRADDGKPLHFCRETDQQVIAQQLMAGRQSDFIFFEHDAVDLHQVVESLRQIAEPLEFPHLFENLSLPYADGGAPLMCDWLRKGQTEPPRRIDVVRPRFIGTFDMAVTHLVDHGQLHVSLDSVLGREIQQSHWTFQRELWQHGCIIVPGRPAYTLAYRPARAVGRIEQVRDQEQERQHYRNVEQLLVQTKVTLTTQLVWLQNALAARMTEYGFAYFFSPTFYRIPNYDTRGPVGCHPVLASEPIVDWRQAFDPAGVVLEIRRRVDQFARCFSVMTGGSRWLRSPTIHALLERWQQIGPSIKTNWARFRTHQRRFDLLRARKSNDEISPRLFALSDPWNREDRSIRSRLIRIPGGGRQRIQWPVLFDWLDERSVRLSAPRPFMKPRGLPRLASRRKK